MDCSVALPVDRSDIECEQNRSPAEDEVEYPYSQELFSGSERRTDCETSPSGDENSLFQAEEICAPTRTGRLQRSNRQTLRSLSTVSRTSDDSSDSDSLPLPQEIAEYLKNPFCREGKKKKKKTRKNRCLVRSNGSQRGTKKQNIRKPKHSIPLEERERRLRDQGIQFPFTPLKYLSYKQYFPYEQFVLGGFLNHVKDLKFEHSLKESLNDMNEDLENENLPMGKYSYMDEDGPLSPISESGENINEDEAEEEVKIVENSAFIVDCQVPSKKNWHIVEKN